MVKQKLHESCDILYQEINNIYNARFSLRDNKIISAHESLIDVEIKLSNILTTIREIALRTEGEYEC